jgi:P27 family predicted phage terminase small subunit
VRRPRMPKTLSPVAQAKWKELVRELNRRGTLTSADAGMLEVAAELYARWRLYVDDIYKRGPYIEEVVLNKDSEPSTRMLPNPSTKLATAMETSLRQMLKELGVTPSSRDGVKPAAPPKAAAPVSARAKIAALKEEE